MNRLQVQSHNLKQNTDKKKTDTKKYVQYDQLCRTQKDKANLSNKD